MDTSLLYIRFRVKNMIIEILNWIKNVEHEKLFWIETVSQPIPVILLSVFSPNDFFVITYNY